MAKPLKSKRKAALKPKKYSENGEIPIQFSGFMPVGSLALLDVDQCEEHGQRIFPWIVIHGKNLSCIISSYSFFDLTFDIGSSSN